MIRKVVVGSMLTASVAVAQPEISLDYNFMMHSNDQGYLKVDGQDDPSRINNFAVDADLLINKAVNDLSFEVTFVMTEGTFADGAWVSGKPG